MRKPKLRELVEAVKVLLIEGPYTAPFPKKPSVPPEEFRGTPAFNDDVCIGCGACAEVCPSRSIDVVDDLALRIRTITLHTDICNFCGQCHAYCTTNTGIDYTGEYDLASLSRDNMIVTVEKELAVCERCGEVAGTVDQLRWVFERLGSLAYANPSLVLAGAAGDDMAAPPHPQGRPYGRDDLFRVLCPSCRRVVFLEEEWG